MTQFLSELQEKTSSGVFLKCWFLKGKTTFYIFSYFTDTFLIKVFERLIEIAVLYCHDVEMISFSIKDMLLKREMVLQPMH